MPVARTYIECVRAQYMNDHSRGNWSFHRLWSAWFGDERIVRHVADTTIVSIACRALVLRGFKGPLHVMDRKTGGQRLFIKDLVAHADATGPARTFDPAAPPLLTVEVSEDAYDWPQITNDEDRAAFAAYVAKRHLSKGNGDV